MHLRNYSIDLTQVHNITVNAKYIFTFGRLPLFTLKFHMNLTSSNADNETFWTVLLTSQVIMVQSLQPKDLQIESTCVLYLNSIRVSSFIIDLHLLLLFL